MSGIIDAIRSRPMPVSADVDIDEFCAVMSNTRRRRVIDEIAELQDGETVTLDELADSLSNQEPGTRQKAVYISLYQTHIEKLVETGVLSEVVDPPNVYTTGRNSEAFVKALDQLESLVGGDVDEH